MKKKRKPRPRAPRWQKLDLIRTDVCACGSPMIDGVCLGAARS